MPSTSQPPWAERQVPTRLARAAPLEVLRTRGSSYSRTPSHRCLDSRPPGTWHLAPSANPSIKPSSSHHGCGAALNDPLSGSGKPRLHRFRDSSGNQPPAGRLRPQDGVPGRRASFGAAKQGHAPRAGSLEGGSPVELPWLHVQVLGPEAMEQGFPSGATVSLPHMSGPFPGLSSASLSITISRRINTPDAGNSAYCKR